MGTLQRSILACAAAVLLSACASTHTRFNSPELAEPRAELEYQFHPAQVYTPEGWPQTLSADVYRPSTAGPLPAILLVHGGGWVGGDRTQMNRTARRLAAAGFVVVNVSYRLAPEHTFPAPIADLRQALRWMVENQKALNLDPARIAAWGYSAGAHLAALLGADASDWPTDLPRPAAIVVGGIPADLRSLDGTLVRQFLGGTPETVASAYLRSSPLTWVSPDDPPVFIYHGAWDWTVPLAQAQAYHVSLNAERVANELLVLSGRGHVAAFLFDQLAIERGIDFLRRWLNVDEHSGT